MPSDRVLVLATSRNMPIKDWLYHLLPEFRLYWLDRNIKKDSWDSTFWNHAKHEFERLDKRSLYEPKAEPQKPIERTTQKPKIEPFSQEKRIAQCDKFLKELKH